LFCIEHSLQLASTSEVSICQHTSAYVSIRQHASACVHIRQHRFCIEHSLQRTCACQEARDSRVYVGRDLWNVMLEQVGVCVCVRACVSVCVCMRERERAREIDRETRRVCVCERERPPAGGLYTVQPTSSVVYGH
jgi:hypothetical protein